MLEPLKKIQAAMQPVHDKVAAAQAATAAARDTAERARQELADELASDSADPSTVAKLRKAKAEAEERHADSQMRLAVLEGQARAAQTAQERAHAAEMWDVAMAAAKDRQDGLEQLQADAARLAATYRRVLSANSRIYAALPAPRPGEQHDLDGAALRPFQMETALRLELAREGASLGQTFDHDTLKAVGPLGERFKGAAELIASWRARALGN